NGVKGGGVERMVGPRRESADTRTRMNVANADERGGGSAVATSLDKTAESSKGLRQQTCNRECSQHQPRAGIEQRASNCPQRTSEQADEESIGAKQLWRALNILGPKRRTYPGAECR